MTTASHGADIHAGTCIPLCVQCHRGSAVILGSLGQTNRDETNLTPLSLVELRVITEELAQVLAWNPAVQ